MYRRFGERLLDLALTALALLFLSPVMAAVALLVRLKLGSPVLSGISAQGSVAGLSFFSSSGR